MQRQELMIPGPVGALEALVQLPDAADYSRFAIICHPHPLQDGNMQNKVVTTLAKSFATLDIPSIRFNFRGVGKSEGSYGDMRGEVDDCLAIVEWVQEQWPYALLYFGGFSFGAYVAAAAASQTLNAAKLITIAPSVERMPYATLSPVKCPWLVIQGEVDEVVRPEAVYSWFDQLQANKTMVKFPECGHFFHGKLVDLQRVLQDFIQSN